MAIECSTAVYNRNAAPKVAVHFIECRARTWKDNLLNASKNPFVVRYAGWHLLRFLGFRVCPNNAHKLSTPISRDGDTITGAFTSPFLGYGRFLKLDMFLVKSERCSETSRNWRCEPREFVQQILTRIARKASICSRNPSPFMLSRIFRQQKA